MIKLLHYTHCNFPYGAEFAKCARALIITAAALALALTASPSCHAQYTITFNKMYVVDDAEAGSGDWKLRADVGPKQNIDLITMKEAGSGRSIYIRKSEVVASLPVRIKFKVWEYDREIFGGSGWDYGGAAEATIRSTGDHSFRIRGSEGHVVVYITVARDVRNNSRGSQVVFRRQGHLGHPGPIGPTNRDWYFNAYNINLTARHFYTIDLQSSDFDTKLLLKNSAGNVIRMNDDGGRGLNSRIVFTPSTSGTYRIVATTYHKRATGNYTLTVRR